MVLVTADGMSGHQSTVEGSLCCKKFYDLEYLARDVTLPSSMEETRSRGVSYLEGHLVTRRYL